MAFLALLRPGGLTFNFNIMKTRNSITEIIKKSNHLAILSDRLTNDFNRKTVEENANLHYRYLTMIQKAALHEILRLEVDKYELGYETGFYVAAIAERGINKAQKAFDEIDQAPGVPPTKLATYTSAPGPGSMQSQICGSIKL